MTIFIVDVCGKLFEFNNVYKIVNYHNADECIMIHFLDEKSKNHWHWFTFSEIVSMEIIV